MNPRAAIGRCQVPIRNSGKNKNRGNRVIIKLENYAFIENGGALDGEVKIISRSYRRHGKKEGYVVYIHIKKSDNIIRKDLGI